MDILALDIGTHTGYAYNKCGNFFAGTWDLATAKEVTQWGKQRLTRRQDPRVCRLLNEISALGWIDTVVFEDVQFVKSQMQGQLWASLRAAVWTAHCSIGATIIEAVPVHTLKQFATGKGGADKLHMAKALHNTFPHEYTEIRIDRNKFLVYHRPTNSWLDDNAVDAVWLWHWGQKNLSRL